MDRYRTACSKLSPGCKNRPTICRGNSSPVQKNRNATTSEQPRVTPMACRMRRTSRAPQYWLKKMEPPVAVPKQNRLNINVKRLAWVTPLYAASPRALTISPSTMCRDAATSC